MPEKIRLPKVGEIWEARKCAVVPCCDKPLLIQGHIRPGVCECEPFRRPHSWGDQKLGPFEVTDPYWAINGSGGWCWSRVECGCLVPRDDFPEKVKTAVGIQNCEHKQMVFGSGGYYVYCLECCLTWVAVKQGQTYGDKDLDYNRSEAVPDAHDYVYEKRKR